MTHRILRVAIVLPALLLFCGGLIAADPDSETTSALEAGKAALTDRPTVAGEDPPGWRGLTPTNISDLREMERQVQAMLPRAESATVGLSVGAARGSGVIVTAKGHVMTAGHVSGRPGRNVIVYLADGTRVKGRSLGFYGRVDAGLVEITDEAPEGGWPFVPLAESGDLVNGEWCFSLGHLGGYDKDRGAVLRIGRVIRSRLSDIWTDCTLLGGDSGGPLFNMSGQVIGIHSRIARSTEANLHVPSDVYIKHWNALVRAKNVQIAPGFLGVATKSHEDGVRIERVVEDTAADEAGLKVGDIISQVDSRPVYGREHFARMMASRDAGDTVTFTVDRGERRLEIQAVLQARQRTLRGEVFRVYDPRVFAWLGVWLAALDDFQRAPATRLATHATARAGAAGIHASLLCELADADGIEDGLPALAARTSPDRARVLCERFDALATLRFVHRVRDRVHPDLPLRDALAAAPFVDIEASASIAEQRAALAEQCDA